jgi:hypothetical protein
MRDEDGRPEQEGRPFSLGIVRNGPEAYIAGLRVWRGFVSGALGIDAW